MEEFNQILCKLTAVENDIRTQAEVSGQDSVKQCLQLHLSHFQILID